MPTPGILGETSAWRDGFALLARQVTTYKATTLYDRRKLSSPK